jgi:hypothetical protein
MSSELLSFCLAEGGAFPAWGFVIPTGSPTNWPENIADCKENGPTGDGSKSDTKAKTNYIMKNVT